MFVRNPWLIACLLGSFIAIFVATPAVAAEDARPNILWLSTEDIGPHLGCYGDEVARTPKLDRLAKKGTLYETAWSTCPVCAPARTTIITGVYPAATGGEHMRSMVPLPEMIRMFPAYLREAGYYCTNSSKEDYNHPKVGEVWNESSRKGHWKNRKSGQPFFAVFNQTMTHESKIRTRPHKQVTKPADIRLPAYHPDRPEVREDWGQYYDNIARMDDWVDERLKELEQAGLADNTIVVFFGDHGSGMPRGKRYPGDSGLRVPMIVYVPDKLRDLAPEDYGPGARSKRLVGFIDLAPTMLSLAGIQPPAYMQGHAFLGKYAADQPEYLYGFRGRMDERIDLVRSLRDQQYLYLRNYMPHRPHGQHVNYQFVTPTTRIWKQLYDEGQLSEAQASFWAERAPEELYDLKNDPDGVKNLAASAEHQETLDRFREAHRRQTMAVRDVLFVPEGMLSEIASKEPPYTYAHDPKKYDLKMVLATADAASRRDADLLPAVLRAAEASDPIVRYWSATGLLVRGKDAVSSHAELLHKMLKDNEPSVRVVAAEALARFGKKADRAVALKTLLENADVRNVNGYTAVAALNAIDVVGDLPESLVEDIRKLPTKDARVKRGDYVARMVKTISGK